MLSGYRTFIGLFVAAIPNIATLFGYEVAPEFSQQANEFIESAITILGLLIALYGRMKATVPGWFARR